MGKIFAIITLLAGVLCFTRALEGQAGAVPNTVVQTGADGTIIQNGKGGTYLQGPGGTILHNSAGGTILQNGAGSIYTRPDGRRVLVGSNGQTLVTRPDSDEDSSDSGEYDKWISDSGDNQNVIINGQSYGSGSGGNVLIGGQNGVFINGGQTVRVVNGGLQLTEGGRDYVFKPRAPGVTEQEQVEINGHPATVFYEQGGVRVERQDGTVLAYGINGEGLFMGDKQAYAKRKEILADIPRQTAQIGEEVRRSMEKLQAELQQSLGNIRLGPWF
ncbi:uncharacterized protein LOC115624981 [Scaptodrosophila lebanonensis]|uniref:Uncharacterized protein LOC115624981 n=1 Tax=Drosophila lebanonensis TaxID=7225 RepID=A0A6J2TG42_DROLE|nr:uncharacterized protein LOC115624981 [Scaptodrosophila lebanonensis]